MIYIVHLFLFGCLFVFTVYYLYLYVFVRLLCQKVTKIKSRWIWWAFCLLLFFILHRLNSWILLQFTNCHSFLFQVLSLTLTCWLPLHVWHTIIFFIFFHPCTYLFNICRNFTQNKKEFIINVKSILVCIFFDRYFCFVAIEWKLEFLLLSSNLTAN